MKRRHSNIIGISVIFAFLFISLVIGGDLWAAPFSRKNQKNVLQKLSSPKKLTYQIYFTPIAWWQKLLKKQKPSIVMRYGTWLKNWKQSHVKLEQFLNKLPKTHSTFQSMKIEGRVVQKQLQLKLIFRLHLVDRGWHKLKLPLKNIALASIKFSRLKGILYRERGDLWLLVRGSKEGLVEVEGGVRIIKTNRGNKITFGLPSLKLSEIFIELPKNQEVSNYKTLQVLHKKDKTILFGGLNGGQLSVIYRTLEKGSKQQAIISATVQSHYEIYPTLQWLNATIKIHSHIGTKDEIHLQYPPKFKLININAPELSDFIDKKQSNRMTIRFRKREKIRIFKLRFVRQGFSSKLNIQPIRIIGAYEQTGKLSIKIDKKLKYKIIGQDAVHRIPNRLPSKIAQLYFNYWQASAKVLLHLEAIKTNFAIHQELTLSLQAQQARLSVKFTISVKEGSLYHIRWKTPKDWHLYEIRNKAGKELRHWHHGRLWQVELSKRLSKGEKSKIYLKFVSITLPKTPYHQLYQTLKTKKTSPKQHQKYALQLPSLTVLGTQQQQGIYNIVYPHFYNGEVQKPHQLQVDRKKKRNLKNLTLSYKILGVPYRGWLYLQRRLPRLHLLTVAHYRLEDDLLHGDIDAYFQISGSSIRKLKIILTNSRHLPIRFISKQAQIISQIRQNDKKNGSIWTLELAKEHFGKLALTMRFQQHISNKKTTLILPMMKGIGNSFERGFISLSSSAHTKLTTQTTHLQAIDPLIIPRPLQRLKKSKALFAYRYHSAKRTLSLKLTRYKAHPLHLGIIRHFSIMSSLDKQSRMRVIAIYRFQSYAQTSFTVRLPQKSELWAVELNGKGLKPLRKKQKITIELPSHTSRREFNIRLTYLSTVSALPRRWGTLKTHLPKVDYPIQETEWSLELPHQYNPIHLTSPFPVYGIQKTQAFITTLLHIINRYPLTLFLTIVLIILFFIRNFIEKISIYLFILFIKLLQKIRQHWIISSISTVTIFFLFFFLFNTLSSVQTKEAPLLQVGKRFSTTIVSQDKKYKLKEERKNSPKPIKFLKISPQKLMKGKQGIIFGKIPSKKNLSGKRQLRKLEEQAKRRVQDIPRSISRITKKHIKLPTPPPPPAPAKPLADMMEGDQIRRRPPKKRRRKKRKIAEKSIRNDGSKNRQQKRKNILISSVSNQPKQSIKMLNMFDSRKMKGIRSIKVRDISTGWKITTRGLGKITELNISIWQEWWLRMMLFLTFIVSFILWIILGLWMRQHRHLLIWSSLFLSMSLALLLDGTAILFANALTFGIISSSLILLLKSHKTIILTIFLLLTFHLNQAEATPDHHLSSPKFCSSTYLWANKKTNNLPSHIKLYVPYQSQIDPTKLNENSSVLVPHSWWLLMNALNKRQCPQSPPISAPYSIQAAYQLSLLDNNKIMGIAKFRVQLLKKGWTNLSFGLQKTQIISTKIDEKLVSIGINNKGVFIPLKGIRSYKIEIKFFFYKRPKEHRFSLNLAASSTKTLLFSIPKGYWQVKIPQAKGGIQSTYKKKRTEVRAILGFSKNLNVHWKPLKQEREKTRESANVSTYTHVFVHEHLIRVRSRFQVAHSYKKNSHFSFILPSHVLLEEITSPHLRNWHITTHNKQKKLTITLKQALKNYRIDVRYVQLRKKLDGQLQIPLLKPIGISRHVGLLGLNVSPILQWTSLEMGLLEKRKPSEYKTTTANWGGIVKEAYSYRRLPSIKIRLKQQKMLPVIQIHNYLNANFKKIHLRSRIRYLRRTHPVFILTFLLSPHLKIEKIHSIRGSKIRQTWLKKESKHLTKLYVELERPLQNGQSIEIKAIKTTNKIKRLPFIVPLKSYRLYGKLFISYPASAKIQTENLRGLEAIPLTARKLQGISHFQHILSYRFHRQYNGKITLTHSTTTLDCKTILEAHVKSHSLNLTAHLKFHASGVGRREFSFSIPSKFAQQIELKQQPNQQIKQTKRNNKTYFTIKTIQPRKILKLSFQFQILIPKDNKLMLPSLMPEFINQWKLYIIFSKQEHIRLFIDKPSNSNIRKLMLNEIRQFSRILHQKNIVSGYQITQKQWSLGFHREILHTEIGLKPIIEMAHLQTTLSYNNNAWTQATYTLRTPHLQFLKLTLPPHSKLWRILVAGNLIHLAKQKKTFLIPLPPTQTSDLSYKIQILYAHPLPLPKIFGDIHILAPSISPITISQTFWTLYYPKNFHIFQHSGNMEQTTLMQMHYNKLKSSLGFYQKLQTIYRTGSQNEKLRAHLNITRQFKQIKSDIKIAQKKYYQSLNQINITTKQKKRITIFNNKINELSYSLKNFSKQQHKYTSLHKKSWKKSTIHTWQRRFGLTQQKFLIPTHHHYKKRHLTKLTLLKYPNNTSFMTVGGKVNLTLSIYQYHLFQQFIAWIFWALLSLLTIIFWYRKNKK